MKYSLETSIIILGAGVTGLAAGFSSGTPIYETKEYPGGICSSYYLRPVDPTKSPNPPADDEAYRFELGGGHWIFGADSDVLNFIGSITPFKTYERQSAVFFPDQDLFVPYPLQNHLSYLPYIFSDLALVDILRSVNEPGKTLADWLLKNFGKTLCELFFSPFHDLYTAGLQHQIAPQDSFKSPVDTALILKGAQDKTPAVGYNANFAYPSAGLNDLIGLMAKKCSIFFGKAVVGIDLLGKEIRFDDSSTMPYCKILSTLPLHKMMAMTGLNEGQVPDPYTSVLVLNIGAKRGPRCPGEHWLYVPKSHSGFHRVGFYSNVDISFLPVSARYSNDRVSIYVERSFRGGEKPNSPDTQAYTNAVIRELQSWGFIGDAEVVDATWIPTAYTWTRPGSDWPQTSLKLLEEHGVYQVGRYGRWKFQGIAESLREGLSASEKFNSDK